MRIPNFGAFNFGKAFSILKFIQGVRWLLPSESEEDEDCAVMEVSVKVEPEAIAMLGLALGGLRMFDSHVDTDHPIFEYLGGQQVKGEPAKLAVTLSIRKAEGEG